MRVRALVVQVVKDPLGTKGARLTTNISVASRYLVFMPALCAIPGSPRSIEDEDGTPPPARHPQRLL